MTIANWRKWYPPIKATLTNYEDNRSDVKLDDLTFLGSASPTIKKGFHTNVFFLILYNLS